MVDITTLRTHLFRLDHPSLAVSGLGNHAVWAGVLRYVAVRDRLDAWVIPQRCEEPGILPLWNLVFPGRVVSVPPDGVESWSAPDDVAKHRGLSAPNVIDCCLWESGFRREDSEKVRFPVLWRHDPKSNRAMLCPFEYTDANRYYNEDYWCDLACEIRKRGMGVGLFGVTPGRRDQGNTARITSRLVGSGLVDRVYPSTLDGIARCISESALSIGSSNGATWACLYSDIPQVVLDRPRASDHLWAFERNAPVLDKELRVVREFQPVFGDRRSSRFRFIHGLGDVANVARMIACHTRRGQSVVVDCTPDKEFVFRAVGCEISRDVDRNHEWHHPDSEPHLDFGADPSLGWIGNKVGYNIGREPLGWIASKGDAWEEMKSSPPDITAFASTSDRERIRAIAETLPRPLVLLHTIGNTSQDSKSIPHAMHLPLYRALADACRGTLVLLDWDHRVPLINSYRIRKHYDVFGHLHVHELVCLMEASDLVVGVDSGPLHLAGLTRVPRVGLFRGHHHPARFAVPDERLLSIVPRRGGGPLSIHKRVEYNIVEDGEEDLTPDGVAAFCGAMLAPARYLTGGCQPADVQLQHWVSRMNRINAGQVSDWSDRHRSMDFVLREATARFPLPAIVETGTIRSQDDWNAGYSTYVFAAYAARRGGFLRSIDLNERNCQFARERTSAFAHAVEIVCARGRDWLAASDAPIDVLYLDSQDTDVPGHEQECLDELVAAERRLHGCSIVVIDDTPLTRERWCGKGALAVPYLLERGWRIACAGYQVVLVRDS